MSSSSGSTQCDHVWSDVRCQLLARHDSAHAARVGRSIVHWSAPPDFNQTISTEWALPEDEDLT